MKKVYLVTLCTCLVVIAFVSASVYFLRDEEKEITVGFVYVGDASTAYTSNFIDAQEAIQTKYGDQVKVIALNNVAEGTESEYLRPVIIMEPLRRSLQKNIPGSSFVWQHVRMQMKSPS